jgi:hypothetical protein
VAEYEALVLGLRAAKEMGIEELLAFGYAEIIVHQIKTIYQAKKPRIRTYRNEVWDLIDNFFLAFNISFIPRRKNTMVDSLVVSTSHFRIPLPPKIKYDIEVIQVDIGGHPPFPASSKQLSSNFCNLLFLAVFRVLNFQSRFEALNDVFLGMLKSKKFIMKFLATIVFLGWIFPMGYRTPKTKIVCKSYDSGKLMY